MAERKSNFEFLRIVCIMLIVVMHTFGTGIGELNTYVGIAVNVIGNIGVTGFVLLSGYFQINLNAKKLIKLDIMIITLSLLSYAMMYGLYGSMSGLGLKEFVTCLIPIISHKYWFLSAYFVLCILSQFINDYISRITKKQLELLIIVLATIFLIIPTVFGFDQTGDGGKGILNMITAYIIGRYIGIYGKEMKLSKVSTSRLIGMFGGVIVLNFVLNSLFYGLTKSLVNYYARDNSVFTMAEAVLLLMIFARMRINSKWINLVAANVVAVYVLEDTIKSGISYVWNYSAASLQGYYIVIVIGVAIVTFAIGCIIEQLRKIILHKPEDMLVDWIMRWVLVWKKQ